MRTNSLGTALFALLVLSQTIFARTVRFAGAKNYVVGTSPNSVSVGDFNGDGKPDLAVGFSGPLGDPGGVSILLNNGFGSFKPAVNYRAGMTPVSVARGDFTHGHKLDLALANANDNTISILFGNGDGSFQKAVTLPVGQDPNSVAAADLNRDGNLDLIAANYSSNTVSVILGNGDGNFQARADYSVQLNPLTLTVGDINGDKTPDIVVGAKEGAVSTLLGNGDGTFQHVAITAIGGNFVRLADFNRDGKLDLLVRFGVFHRPNVFCKPVGVCYWDDDIEVYPGNGNGTFRAGTAVTVSSHNNSDSFDANVDTGDFEGNGVLDLAVPLLYNSSIDVLLGLGNATFQPGLNFATPSYPLAAAIGDFNGDSAPDVALTSGTNVVSVLLNANGTTIRLNSSPNPSHLGQSITFTITVAAAVPGSGIPTGTVNFKDGTTTLAKVPVIKGQARLTISTLGVGKHNLQTSYSGDSTFNPNNSKIFIQTVLP
jgi:hypothetical protein